MFQGAIEHYLDPQLYDEEYKNRRTDVRFYIKWSKSLLKNKPQRMVELGCGTGRLTIPLIKKGFSVLGIDQSSVMLDHLREKLSHQPEKYSHRLTTVQGNLLQLEHLVQNEKFPLVICPFHTLMHFHKRRDVLALFSKIHTILDDDGYFIFDILMPDIRWLIRNPEKRWSKSYLTHPKTDEKFCYTTNHLYDPVSQVALIHMFYQSVDEKKIAIPSQKEKVAVLSQRQFFPEEILQLIDDGMFTVKHKFGDFNEASLGSTSEQQIFILQKAFVTK